MSAVLPAPRLGAAWRVALPPFVLALLAVLLLYRSTFAAMVDIWSRSDTFAHAFLVPPIALWLAWRRRAVLAACTPRPQPWVLLPLLLAAAGWLLGDMAGVNAVTQLAATTLLVLTVPALLGITVARELAFPLGFLYFMVPIGEFMLPLLMRWTADFTVFAVSSSGVPVYREGQQFIIPTGTWSVVEACSGVRYLMASFMVGTLFAYLNYNSMRRRLLFCLVSIVVPVVANWVRAYMIVMLGHLSGNKLAVGVDHLVYGWVFFGVVVLLMFFIGARWSQPELPPQLAAAARPLQSAPPALPWLWAALLVLVLVPPPMAASRLNLQAAAASSTSPSTSPPLQLVLPALAGTGDAAPPANALQPVFEGAAGQAVRHYGTLDGTVTVQVAYYRQQGYGRKLVSSRNVLVHSDDRLWNRMSQGQATVQTPGGPLVFNSAEVLFNGTGARQRLDVRQLYWVDGQWTASDHIALLRGLLGRLAGRGDDAAMLTVWTAGEPAATEARLQQFLAAHVGALGSWLQGVRAER